MKYLTCIAQDTLTLATANVPQPGPGEMIVRLTMCGVCGTDVAKVFGDYPKPQKLGHEVVGIVHETGPGVTRFKPGERVALAHHVPDFASHYTRRGSETMDPAFKRSNIEPGGFSEFIRVPAPHVIHTVMPIPDHVPDKRAVFMEPLACCLRAIDRVPLQQGDSALVVGVGAVGILFMPLLAAMGVTTIATDVRTERVALAEQWGATPAGGDIPAACKAASEGRGVDAVILTAVNEATMKLALASVRDGGTVILFGGKPGGHAALPLWDIWLREINLVSSYSATPDGLRRAISLLAGKSFEGIEALVSHEFTLAEAQAGFDLVHQSKASKVVIIPQ
jgi:L-iditol 2-dehydrogenase